MRARHHLHRSYVLGFHRSFPCFFPVILRLFPSHSHYLGATISSGFPVFLIPLSIVQCKPVRLVHASSMQIIGPYIQDQDRWRMSTGLNNPID
ncbi:hypothetical protein CALVIDRAFT_184994 [Calocera viscosa TUFC12733]|uniref:Uncharacterized protein n=1 Tax=Calocera viscosa (strain TUFC12733) TaxID=1330018 RepID=A0A167L390_CALVF|nr:hypothetical protein CALVIDRAFT_184994 [Calocera viscosa TUFC12733]